MRSKAVGIADVVRAKLLHVPIVFQIREEPQDNACAGKRRVNFVDHFDPDEPSLQLAVSARQVPRIVFSNRVEHSLRLGSSWQPLVEGNVVLEFRKPGRKRKTTPGRYCFLPTARRTLQLLAGRRQP